MTLNDQAPVPDSSGPDAQQQGAGCIRQYLEVVLRLYQGHSNDRICQDLGVTKMRLNALKGYAREAGCLLRVDVSLLDPELSRWIDKITPRGGKRADTIRAILQDAYDEEHPPEEGAD